MEHFGAVHKPDLTEEERTQLQQKAIDYSCLILAAPMSTHLEAYTLPLFTFSSPVPIPLYITCSPTVQNPLHSFCNNFDCIKLLMTSISPYEQHITT